MCFAARPAATGADIVIANQCNMDNAGTQAICQCNQAASCDGTLSTPICQLPAKAGPAVVGGATESCQVCKKDFLSTDEVRINFATQ